MSFHFDCAAAAHGFTNPALLGPWSDDGDVVILCEGFRERLEKWRIDSVVVGN
jgi:hypothetical protein